MQEEVTQARVAALQQQLSTQGELIARAQQQIETGQTSGASSRRRGNILCNGRCANGQRTCRSQAADVRGAEIVGRSLHGRCSCADRVVCKINSYAATAGGEQESQPETERPNPSLLQRQGIVTGKHDGRLSVQL